MDDANTLTGSSNTAVGSGEWITDRDTVDLAKVGKKQILKRRYGLVSMTGFSCMLMITWEATLVDFLLGLQNGGPAGLIYGYILSWIGTLSVFIAMGELSSMLPTAGGQYHWVSILAPKHARKFLSYITGWATVISWAAAATAVAFFTATLIQTAVAEYIPSYEPQRWQGTLIMWGALVLAVFIATVLGTILPVLEVMLLFVHVLGFFGTMIPLIYYLPKGSEASSRAQQIFGTFFNLGGWSTQTLSFFIGIQGNATAFLGTDGAVHMSEEVGRSSVNVARSMVYSVLINGLLGFAMLLCVLLSVDDIQSLAEPSSTYPFTQILTNGFQSSGGATAVLGLIVFMNFASTVGALSSSSRMMWSFARDRGPPGWRWLRKVDKRTSIPANTVYVVGVSAALLGLINIFSSTAFQDVVSLVLEGFYLSYLFATSMLLYRRIRGDIEEVDDDSELNFNTNISTGIETERYRWGPWRVRGWLGTANNLFAVAYLLIISFFSYWPASASVTPGTMNYSVLVLGGVMIGSIVWYFARARQHYSGPVIETQAAEVRLVSPDGHHLKAWE